MTTAPTAPTRFSARRLFLWLGIAGVLVAAGALAGRAFWYRSLVRTPVAAYLLPSNGDSRIKPALWRTQTLTIPRSLRSGEQVSVPAGSSVLLVHADTGQVEHISGPASLRLQINPPAEINVLVSSWAEVLAAEANPPPATTGSIITSPVNVTRYLNPLLSWVAREGAWYDVAVADAADPLVPLRKASRIRPPITLAELETPQRRQLGVDRNYIIAVRETGSTMITAGARFLTARDAELENKTPEQPAELLAEAITAMARKPFRTGDAWIALSRLPAEWQRSDASVRLRLLTAAELGLTDEFLHARADAAALRGRP